MMHADAAWRSLCVASHRGWKAFFVSIVSSVLKSVRCDLNSVVLQTERRAPLQGRLSRSRHAYQPSRFALRPGLAVDSRAKATPATAR